MLLDRKKYSEFGFIGEELFSNSEDDRVHKCMVAEQTIADGDFSLDEALEAYQLTKEEYENYVAKKSNANILISLSGSVASSYFEVFAKMLESSADQQMPKILHNRVTRLAKELHGISAELNAKA